MTIQDTPASERVRRPLPAVNALDVGRIPRVVFAIVRITAGVLWIQNVTWKHPPSFGLGSHSGLYAYTQDAVTHPVLAPFAFLVKNLVLPNFIPFGYATLLLEFLLGVLLTAGLLTRLVGVVAVLQVFAITFSALYAPHEWQWSYYLMIAVHLVIIAVAAGRTGGVDGLLRPGWAARPSKLNRLLLALS